MAATVANPKLDISAVVTQFGKYYIPGGQGVQDLNTKLFRKLVSERYIGTSRRKETASQVRFGRVNIDEVTQAYQPRWTSKSNVKFLPNAFDIEHIKIEYDFTLDDELVESWLGFLTDTGNEVRSWPIIRYVLEELIIPQHQEDREYKMVYTGVRVEPTLGIAGTAAQSVTGFEKRITDAIASSDPQRQANVITMGALPTSGDLDLLYLQYLLDWLDQVPDLVRENMEPVRVNPTFFTHVNEGQRKKYNAYYKQSSNVLSDNDTDELLTIEKYPRVKLGKSYAQSNKSRIWSCEKGNSVFAMRGAEGETVFSLEKFAAWTASLYTNYWLGYGFKFNGGLWTTDVS